mgnify:CR=1 FL=1|tara:strand:- start:51 stop:464 length:414 start_codon:yes stop_codon:yes gene_type:complete
MPTEILSGLWIGDINDSFDKSFIEDNLIKILINCTEDYGFINTIETKKIRIPLSSNLTPEKDLLLLQNNKDRIIDFILKNISKYNILIYCYDGLKISPLIIALFIINYGGVSKDDIRDILRSKNNKVCLDIDLSYFN